MSQEKSPDERTIIVKSANPANDVADYINFAQTSTTWLDISVTLGQIQEVDPATATVFLRREIRLTMAAEEAKSLGLLLLNAVKGYEEAYGAVRRGGYLGESDEG